ncbi:RICIN domain-containing protein [Streptomyces puniciscabiei]|uniref:RICIN domain-containing protein n=1 Tax=Streptomyces puniciscabiei TaxID=164348 RepID=UPI0006EB6C1B|nr:RICIN domain-containing protein [Streptomyces puniciscabiei]
MDGQTPTTVSFPPTGSAEGTVSVQAHLTKGAANSLTFTGGPALGGVTVHPIPGTDGTLLVGKQSGRCADVHDNTITNGTQAELWDCNGHDNQKWSRT